jgi:hypothetical protein
MSAGVIFVTAGAAGYALQPVARDLRQNGARKIIGACAETPANPA